MTPRPDDEIEAREWAKAHEEKPFDVRWNPAGAYLAGLLAERARGMGTGDDERDAEEYAMTTGHDGINGSGEPPYVDPIKAEAFLAGRKGFVPASEVERLKEKLRLANKRAMDALQDSHIRDSEVIKVYTAEKISEALKRERERCVAIALQYKEVMGPDIARAILTPSGEGEGDE